MFAVGEDAARCGNV